MKTVAAVLQRRSVRPRPTRSRRPLSLEELELGAAGRGRGPRPDRGRRALPLRLSVDQRRSGRGRCRWRSGTRRPASSRRSARASTTWRRATTWSWSSSRAAATACRALEGRPALCEPGAAAEQRRHAALTARRSLGRDGETIHHHLGVSAFAEHAVVSRGRWSDRSRSCRSPRRRCSAARCSPASARSSTPPRCGPAPVGRGRRPRRRRAQCGARGAASPGARRDRRGRPRRRKARLARQLGATDTYNAEAPDVIEAIREATGGGVEYAFEMAGSVKAMELAYRITRRGGTTVTAGLPPAAHASPCPRSISSRRSAP